MQGLFDRIAGGGAATFGAVLHLGAGACQELGDFLRLKAGKIMLVEANPEVLDQLRLRVRGVGQVEVVGAAVATAETGVVLQVLNNPRESSIHRPAQLLERYPNLKITRETPVPATTLNQLVARLAPDVSCDNLLVMEVQGAELSVLSSTPSGTLQKFSWIAIRASKEVLYEGGARLEEVDAVLRRKGFQAAGRVRQSSFSLFQEVLYRRDPLQIQLQELKALLDERDRSIHTLNQSLNELRTDNRQLTQSVERQASLAEDRRGELERLKDEQAKLVAGREQKVSQLKGELEELAKNHAHLKQQLVEATQTASLSIKLQALHEADLKDLQGRYRESLSVQESQHEMLVKLAERLKAASSYFHQMAEAQGGRTTRGLEEKPGPGSKRISRSRASRKRSDKDEGGS